MQDLYSFPPALVHVGVELLEHLELMNPTTSEYKSESDPEEELPQYQPFGEVPLLTYPLQSAPGSSSEHPPIWDQILNNQIAMQGQLNEMEFQQK